MKKLVLFLIILVISIPSYSFAQSFGAKHDKAVKIFQGNQEPTAKDAVWTQRDIFKVGVINDGTSRNGYAQYVCEVLYDEGFKGQGVWVQVIDIVKLNNSGKWVKLGEARCQ